MAVAARRIVNPHRLGFSLTAGADPMNAILIRSLFCVASITLLAACSQTTAEVTGANSFADNAAIGQPHALPEPVVQNATLVSEGPQTAKADIPLLGNDQNDDLSLGKKQFRARNFGLAEKHFRRAVEMSPRDAEAWVGLAASYDRLKRFDEADRAYRQAIAILGPTPEILNNQGFSYLLRGDYRTARKKFHAALAKDPDNPRIRRNIELMEASLHTGKGIATR
jgi:tetratricopeptide (TPR) repeat protein